MMSGESDLATLCGVHAVTAAGLHVTALLSADDVRLCLAPLAQRVIEMCRHRNGHRVIVGISGPAGAGKSVFSALLQRVIIQLWPSVTSPAPADCCCVLGLDGYHHTNAYLEQRGWQSIKGRPVSLDITRFVADIRRVKFQQPNEVVTLPAYDRNLHNPVDDQVCVPPACPIVLVEGILLFTTGNGFEPLVQGAEPLFDLTVFLDLPLDEAKQRVNERKVAGGRSHEDTEAHYARVDLPNHVEMLSGGAHVRLVPEGSFGYRMASR